ncbi:hypothetical protein [Burkholderia aenigmatica]|uniref:DUF1073 domain-containing protein n=1 Tax=Burkholderia aenigmatica TaxID=2015348 RepID=A0A228J3R5_9BURK|nr:hypothetical protein [Burkholderia aenigmatica]OXI49280.1 hypothetical protein CFB84_10545 [Burkholderia aenigmatica]
MAAPSFEAAASGASNQPDCADGFEPQRNTQLYNNLVNEVIEPDTGLSYQLAKQIYLSHPMGQRVVDNVINLAFSQERTISGIPEDAKKAFKAAWNAARADTAIKNVARHARIYGSSTLVDLGEGTFKVYDPLITAGSLVGNLDPLSRDFLSPNDPVVRDFKFTPQNSVVAFNGTQVYLAYSQSAFGYTGRSVFYNMLQPLAAFLISMEVDALVLKKSGVLISKTKPVGAAQNRFSMFWQRKKATDVKKALNGNVLAIETDEDINTLNMANTADAMTTARNNVISNIATALDAPAVILQNDVLTNGFGEGKEDSKVIAQFVERYRGEIEHLFEFITPKIQELAWTEEWYASFVMSNPAYASIPFQSATNYWRNNFEYAWPNYLTEPDSEKVKREESSFNAYAKIYETLQAGIKNPETRRAIAQALIELTHEDSMKTLLPMPIDIEFADDDFVDPAPTDFKGSERVSEDVTGDPDASIAPDTNLQE